MSAHRESRKGKRLGPYPRREAIDLRRAVEAEREACADEAARRSCGGGLCGHAACITARLIAKAIRARGGP